VKRIFLVILILATTASFAQGRKDRTRSALRRVDSRRGRQLTAANDRRHIEPLLRALQDPAPKARVQAAWVLGAIRADSALPELMDALHDREPDVRSQAAWALGTIGDSRAYGALRQLLSDQSRNVREQAEWALSAVARDLQRRRERMM